MGKYFHGMRFACSLQYTPINTVQQYQPKRQTGIVSKQMSLCRVDSIQWADEREYTTAKRVVVTAMRFGLEFGFGFKGKVGLEFQPGTVCT